MPYAEERASTNVFIDGKFRELPRYAYSGQAPSACLTPRKGLPRTSSSMESFESSHATPTVVRLQVHALRRGKGFHERLHRWKVSRAPTLRLQWSGSKCMPYAEERASTNVFIDGKFREL